MDSRTVHFLAGGLGGTLGAVCTMPLEVVKVRLQSSRNSDFTTPITSLSQSKVPTAAESISHNYQNLHQQHHHHIHHDHYSRTFRKSKTISTCILQIFRYEGLRGLWKGIGPTLLGVMPSRATYFATYHSSQVYLSSVFGPSHSHIVTLSSAMIGGAISATFTNPIWYIKTKLQLDNTTKATWWTVCRTTWKEDGIRGFYRGIQASYFGVFETALHFLVYENIKRQLLDWAHTDTNNDNNNNKNTTTNTSHNSSHPTTQLHRYSDMLFCMMATGCSKSLATFIMYPHEVARTRLREGNPKYRRFFTTLFTVVEEEGFRGLYRGLVIHFARQLPNSCIMIAGYEGIVYLLNDLGFVKQSD